MEKWSFRITASHLLENLGTELYEDSGDCLWEIVRNGVIASMNGNTWEPGVGHVEIFLVYNHPLAPNVFSLVILDHGCGFTDPRIKLFCAIGRSREDRMQYVRGTHGGAAQKRIGRFAAWAMNAVCADEDNPERYGTGFYIMTRTSNRGPVKLVSMVPDDIEKEQGVYPRTIESNSTELHELKDVKGSFTAIVIPNSVFRTPAEIREALKWRIPRKPDQMFKLMIAGKALEPPPLADKVTLIQQNGPIEVYLDSGKEDDPKGGIWFTDLASGLRVVCAIQLGVKVPFPIWHPTLVGDIFVPNLLDNQNTSRSSLSPKYLKSQPWHRAQGFLALKATEPAKALLGKREEFGHDKVSQLLVDFVSECNKRFGTPKLSSGLPFTTPTSTGGNISGGGGGGGGTRTNVKGERIRSVTTEKHRVMPVRIGEDEFMVTKRPMAANLFAQVDTANGKVLYINDRYTSLPATQAGKSEHVMLMTFNAVGCWKFPSSASSAMEFTAARRQDMLGK